MEPYEGREPYIFISYARRDAERAAPLLDALSGAGYRVWWDRGIQAGEPWKNTLLDKINGCAVFCPLFSEAFNASRYCFWETAWAYQNDKKIVPLHLEELKNESLGRLYRRLQEHQGLRPYQYDSPAQFAGQLERQEAFAPCKIPEWRKVWQIQWRLSTDGVLSIAKNEDLPEWFESGSIPAYQYDPLHDCSTAPWASYREKILSVEIADDIKAIGDYAFKGCKHLTNVRIPDSVTKIGEEAFCDCHSLTNVFIPDGVTKINVGTFYDCHDLTDVRIPDSVTYIGYFAFIGCENLKRIVLPAKTRCGGAFPAFPDHTLVLRSSETWWKESLLLERLCLPYDSEIPVPETLREFFKELHADNKI